MKKSMTSLMEEKSLTDFVVPFAKCISLQNVFLCKMGRFCCSFCKMYFFAKRTDALPGEYLRKARDTDRTYCGTVAGDQGPVERRLLGFPSLIKLVMGPNAECSEDMHELLNSMAESKTKYQCRMKGEVESEWKIASNLTYLRRQLSVCGVRAVADSLLCRLQQAGPAGRGAAAAEKRRAEASNFPTKWGGGLFGKKISNFF